MGYQEKREGGTVGKVAFSRISKERERGHGQSVSDYIRLYSLPGLAFMYW